MTEELAMDSGAEEEAKSGSAPTNGQQQSDYNPAEHLMQIGKDKKDYLTADQRLRWFNQECPNGEIETIEMEIDHDRVCEAEIFVWNAEKRRSEKVIKSAKGYARFRAIGTDGKGKRRTATGSETAVDFPDYIEKAETKSVARVLGFLGYGTLDAQIEGELRRPADSPRTPLHQNGTNTNGNGSRPNPPPKNGRPTPLVVQDALRALSLTEQAHVETCWKLLSPEEKAEVISFCGIGRPREKGWTLEEYRCFLSNIEKKTITKRMAEQIYTLVKPFPQASYNALRQRLGGNIAKSKVSGYTWSDAASIHTLLVECQQLHDLGMDLDPNFTNLKTSDLLKVDHPLDLFLIEEGVEKQILYLKFLQEKYQEDRSKLPPEIKDRHKALIASWEQEAV